jgi:type IV pilus assembly protein PilW
MRTRGIVCVPRQRGFSLIEIMVALLIALFLLGGLGSMVGTTRRTSTNQNSLAQLQDQQRLAMSMLNDVIQTAGYFDTSVYWDAPSAFSTTTTAGTMTLAIGQYITGTHTSVSAPDTLAVRYTTTGSDGVMSCNGTTNASVTTYVNYFFVNTATTPNQLQCSLDGKTGDAITLVNNVVNFQVWYGVSTVATNNNVDTYMTADQVTAAGQWNGVASARVTLTIDNPLWGQPGQSQYSTITRLIALQNRTGPAM